MTGHNVLCCSDILENTGVPRSADHEQKSELFDELTAYGMESSSFTYSVLVRNYLYAVCIFCLLH